MGHFKYASDVGTPVDVAFTYTDNYQFVPDWGFGVAGFEPIGDIDHGSGAVFAVKLRIGFWHPTIECELTEHRRNAVIEYTLRRRRPGKTAPACSAPLFTLTLRFDPLGYGRSVLTSEAEYWAPRGLTGKPLSKLLALLVQTCVRRTEAQLRREIEEFHGTDVVGRIA